MPKKRHFTLIEVMIVMVIMGILIAMATGGVYLIGRTKIEMQSRKLAGDLLWVRELSVNQPSNITGENYYTVSFNCSNNWYGLYAGNADNTGRILKQESVWLENISVTHPDTSGNAIGLSPAQLRFYSPSGTMVDPTINNAFVTPRNKVCVNLRGRSMRVQVKVYGNTGYVKILLNNATNPLSDGVCD